MQHLAIKKVLERVEIDKSDSDYTYFFSLLIANEVLVKTIVLGIVASITDDKDRNRYRLEYQIVRAAGLGEWSKNLEDAVSGPASQFLHLEANTEQREITQICKKGEWQYEAVILLKAALTSLGVDCEEVPAKTDLKRWFRLFSTLRNKTRGHGATRSSQVQSASDNLHKSFELIYNNLSLFKRPWVHLHRNISGKYRISPITKYPKEINLFEKEPEKIFQNGVYIYIDGLRPVRLMATDADLRDFYFANGGLTSRKYEMLSYVSDDKIEGDINEYLTPPGVLPPSETEGQGELYQMGRCFTNVPTVSRDYIARPKLETELLKLLSDDKRPIVTLVGRGGIGKTSLALKVIPVISKEDRYETIIWLSARDVDLQLSGPKPVRPAVLSPDDIGELYCNLVFPPSKVREKGFKPREYFEKQMQKSNIGPCLFVFDNFETTQNPVEMFNWIDSFIRLPNKALITTRLREFKGDYPVEVSGMEDEEARQLISKTADGLGISEILNPDYINELLDHSEGHPYVIKILLGEVAKAKRAANIPRMVAGTDDILIALFERTYLSLSPCAQRAFLTLSSWNSPVPKLALEAVLYRSTEERQEVEKGIETLIQYSMAEINIAPGDNQEFISLPLVASSFGKKKLNISPSKTAIQNDVEVLQMLGPSRRDDVHLGLAKRIEKFISNLSQKIENGARYEEYAPVLEAICRAYSPGWLILAKWHLDQGTIESTKVAKERLKNFLEGNPSGEDLAEAWTLLGKACRETNDALGEIHALIARAGVSQLSFSELSNTANRLNQILKDHGFEIDKDDKKALASRLLEILSARSKEALASDFTRMAWLAIHSGKETVAREFVEKALNLDSLNIHASRLANRLGINS